MIKLIKDSLLKYLLCLCLWKFHLANHLKNNKTIIMFMNTMLFNMPYIPNTVHIIKIYHLKYLSKLFSSFISVDVI